jgi:DNA-binding response OmpR family regulator
MTSGHVLVVDDDPDIRETLGLVLGQHGFSVSTAADGAEALKQLRAEHRRPCLILLDLMMPGMDGFELWQRIDTSDLSDIPVVVLTGAGAQVSGRASALKLEVLPKPIELRVLLKTVRRFCKPS